MNKLIFFIFCLNVSCFLATMETPMRTILLPKPAEVEKEGRAARITFYIHEDFLPQALKVFEAHKLVESVSYGNCFVSNFRKISVTTSKQKNIVADSSFDRFKKLFDKEECILIRKNARKKLKNIIAAYQLLSSLRRENFISYEHDKLRMNEDEEIPWKGEERNNLSRLCWLARIRNIYRDNNLLCRPCRFGSLVLVDCD